jgi:drug/metabolite transporter (DMT)-like permease
MGPLFTMLIARVWLKEALTSRKLLGLLLAIGGLVMLIGWNPIPLNSKSAWAIAASVTAAICYGFANVFSRVKFANRNPMQTSSGQLLGAAVLVLPVVLHHRELAVFSARILGPLLVLGILCTALAFIIYFKLIDSVGSVNTSVVMILVPFFGVLWSAIFLGEPVTTGLIIGLLLIIAGLSLILRPARKSFSLQLKNAA